MNDHRGIEAEIIYGAMRREKLWKIAAVCLLLAALASIGAASFVVVSYRAPAPIIVPFDPATGLAVPNASVKSISLDEEAAVVQAKIYHYVQDRETYNQIDNDLRIRRALSRSVGVARRDLVRLWDSGEENYPPKRYGDKTQIEVLVTGVSLLGNDRAQVRLRKRLFSPDGENQGNFTVVLKYAFEPGEEKTLEAVWQNPLGFKITEYAITSEKRGEL